MCIGFGDKISKKGRLGDFWIKITNILGTDQSFSISVTRPNPGGYKKNNDPIVNDGLKWLPHSRTVLIKNNEKKNFVIGVEVPKDATDGTYIFDVVVQPYNERYKFYVEVR